nr:integrase, catalytic region, zinc finger, CCHC-type, peptidase aspartic, catalytic [Tanacetum cinerariifolium]
MFEEHIKQILLPEPPFCWSQTSHTYSPDKILKPIFGQDKISRDVITNAQPTLKDLKFWTAKEKKIQKIDRLARSLLIQGLSNDIYSLIDSNETAKDLWDALEKHMRGSENGEQDRKATILYEFETFKATEGEQFLDTYLRYLQVINDLKKCGYKKDNCELDYKFLNYLQPKWKAYGDVNGALGYKKKAVVIATDPLALVAEKTKVSKQKEKVVVSLDSEGSVNTFEEQNNEFNEQIKVFNEKNADLLAQTEVLQDQLKVKCVVIDTHTDCLAQHAKLKEEKYEYMIRYSALCDNDKQHRKKIDEQEILFDKMSRQLVDMNNNVLRLQVKILDKETKISELEGCQTSSVKPYVPTVILEKIIIDLEDEVVSLLEKEKANLKTIESLKSKGFESSENAISESENQSENDCHVVEKECHKVVNSKEIALGMFKLNVSQSVSPISMSKTSCDSKNVENLDTFSSVRRPKQSSVIWKEKGSSNTSNVDLSSISHSKLKKDVKRYSCKYLLSCNNSHLEETSCAYVCNDAMNVSCNSWLSDSFDENTFFIFDDESVIISPISKMTFRKKPRDSLNICLWIIDSRCSKHMMGNHALLTNFVEKFLGTVRFGKNDFAVITGYGDVVIGSMTIKKVYYVEGLGHNLFSVG